MGAIVPGVKRVVDFVRLVDGINCFLDIPETIGRLIYGEKEREAEEEKTYCSIDTLLPIPPNSPWKPMRVGS